jgi:mRNA-degrading endonuclease HigB of HigAB toxin-antitoxin module
LIIRVIIVRRIEAQSRICNLRLITFIEFRDNRMYVKHISSHAESDRLTDKYRRNKE